MAFLSAVVAFSLRNRAVILLATVLFVALGLRSAVELPVDAVPDVTTVQVQVITSAPALSPLDIERMVTIPVERSLAGLPGAEEVRSTSKYGISVVTVVFRDDVDPFFARQVVDERLREASAAVPPQYGRPEMGPISTGLGEIFQFVVRGEGLSALELQALVDWQIGPALRTVPGVVDVNRQGGETKELQIVLEPQRMRALDVSLDEVLAAVERTNAIAGGGYLERDRQHVVVGTHGLARGALDLSKAVVKAAPDGAPVTLAALGEVRAGGALRRGASSRDGEGEVVVGTVLMLRGANARTVTEDVRAKLAALAPSLPEGVRVEPFYDRSVLVDRTVGTIGRNLLEGALLVVGVLLLLLGDVRAGLVVASTIPLALLFAVVIMRRLGLSGNLMSLGAIDFGLVVDGAVIVVENAARRLVELRGALGRAPTAEERVHCVQDATLEVRAASVFGETIIAVVYLPILFLTGMEGKLFRPMATTVLLALAGAFVLSLTLVPVLASLVLRPKETEHDTLLLRLLSRLYEPAFRLAMRHRALVVGAGVLVVALGAGAFGRLGAEFVPQLDEGDILVEARRPPGVALTETLATDARMQRALLAIPEVEHVVGKAGSPALATDSMGMEQSDLYVVLRPKSEWRKGIGKPELQAEIAEALAREAPDVAIGVSQPIQMRTNELVEGIRSDVAAVIRGPDLETLAALGERVAHLVEHVPGAVDVRVEQVAGLRYLQVVPDREALALRGLTVADVNALVETFAVGRPAGTLFEGERRVPVVLRTAFAEADLAALRALPLRGPRGLSTLGEVAELRYETGPAQVSRDKGSRRLAVELNVRGRDMLSVVEDARRVAAAVSLPPGYRMEWTGQFEHYEEARGMLAIVVPITLGVIGVLLWLAFSSVRSALLIFLAVPFAIVGGALALLARGIPFSISAGVGFVALFGVAVLNGLVLVAFARDLERGGADPVEAIERAARIRLRPVLTTALVASLGFIPMAVTTAPGGEVQRPLATVVIGGLVTSTLLTLFVLPAAWTLTTRRRRRAEPAEAAEG